MVIFVDMSVSQKMTAHEKNSETQNLISKAIKRDHDTGIYTEDNSKSGKIRIIITQTKSEDVLHFYRLKQNKKIIFFD